MPDISNILVAAIALTSTLVAALLSWHTSRRGQQLEAIRVRNEQNKTTQDTQRIEDTRNQGLNEGYNQLTSVYGQALTQIRLELNTMYTQQKENSAEIKELKTSLGQTQRELSQTRRELDETKRENILQQAENAKQQAMITNKAKREFTKLRLLCIAEIERLISEALKLVKGVDAELENKLAVIAKKTISNIETFEAEETETLTTVTSTTVSSSIKVGIANANTNEVTGGGTNNRTEDENDDSSSDT